MGQADFYMTDELTKTNDGILIPKKNKEQFISYPEYHDFLVDIEENSFWFKHRNRCITKVVNKFNRLQTFFDVGGGNGYVSMALLRMGIDVVLVEPMIQGARNAVKRGVKNVVCATLEDAGYKKNSIPNIGIFDVLEHIENDDGFLEHLYQMLEKDGHLFITVPAYSFLWSKDDDEAGHFRRYTLKSLSKVLIKAGFQIQFKSYIFSILPFPIFIFRALTSKLGIIKKQETQMKEHNPSFLSKIIDGILSIESKLLMSRCIIFGGSCLVVAKK